MMTMGLWAAVTFLLLASLTETIVFRKRRALLRKNAQYFQFHDLRDRLQLLTIAGKIQPASEPYRFLMFTINVAIRNAGEFKLRHLVDMSQTVKQETDGEELADLIRQYPTEVQALASEVYGRFAWMLVANDDIAVWLFRGFSSLTKIANEAVVKCVKSVVARLVPQHVQVVREANDYRRLGQRLAPSY
jgi:hypothetical protein